jgi:hypothetical protein
MGAFLISTVFLTMALPMQASAENAKVYSGTQCVPGKDEGWKYEKGGIFFTSTCGNTKKCFEIWCPIHRDEVWKSSWEKIEIYLKNAGGTDNIDCVAQILRANYDSEVIEWESVSGTGNTTLTIDKQFSSAGAKAVYGFMCRIEDGKSGIYGYRVTE